MKLLKPPQTAALTRTPRRRRVLALCGDTQVGLWMVRSLGSGGLKPFAVCVSPNGLAAHSRYAAGAWMVEHPARHPDFIDELLTLARRLNVGSIITISETYHSVLIANRRLFEPDIRLLSPGADQFAKATDKDFMYRLCLSLGVPVARGSTLDKITDNPSDLRFPLVLRSRTLNDPAAPKAPWKAAYAATPDQPPADA